MDGYEHARTQDFLRVPGLEERSVDSVEEFGQLSGIDTEKIGVPGFISPNRRERVTTIDWLYWPAV